MRTRLLLLLCCCTFLVNAQIEETPGSARSVALGGQGLTLRSADALFINPAGLSGIEQLSFIGYADNRFGVAGLGTASFGVAKNVGDGAFGFAFQSFSFETFRENKTAVMYGRSLGEFLDVGLQIDWFRTSIAGINRDLLTAEAGVIVHLSDDLHLGAHFFNPVDVLSESVAEVDAPARLRIGLSYDIEDYLMVLAEVDRTLDRNTAYKLGMEYFFAEKVYARLGYQINPSEYAFGIGVQLKQFRLDFAGTAHQVLGLTPHFSAVWQLKSKSQTKE